MARVDFYHLTRDSAEAALAMLAGKALGAGQRMMVVSRDPAQRTAISRSLWEAPGFLANGEAGGEDDARQPVLIGDAPASTNGAGIVALADGEWRDEALGFDRAMLLFSETTIAGARDCWRALAARDEVECHYWSQDGSGRWREGP